MPHKIGIYVRVSTEEQAQVIDGSIDSQQHRLKGFVDLKNLQDELWGKTVETYIDDGYSAKDTNRPAYQRMMKEIRSGKINLILVTDVSRLSRSIHDFCILLKELEENKAKFFSVKEQFDTSTPAGEMMIYNMINLAQFERKQTAERVSVNFHSRAMRGLLNGGAAVLGYDKDPTNSGKFMVNKTEVPLVERIFKTYLDERSLQATVKAMNATGIGPKCSPSRNYRHAQNGRWTISSVRTHLTNLAYIGKREVNRKYKKEDQDFLKPWQKHQIVTAAWPAIIEESDYWKVQTLLADNRQKERDRFASGKAKFFLLSGLLTCGDCGRALIGQASHGRGGTYRYYGHKILVGEPNECKIKRFRAEEIEQAVVDHLDEMLFRSGHLDNVEDRIRKILGGEAKGAQSEKSSVLEQLREVEKEIESAFSLYSEVNGYKTLVSAIKEKLTTFTEKKRTLVARQESILTVLQKGTDAREARLVIEDRAKAFKQGWPKATPQIKKRLVRGLLQRLVYSPDGLYTYYVTAKEVAAEAQIENEKRALESNSGALPNVYSLSARRPTGFLTSGGAPIVSIGGAGGNRTHVRKRFTAPVYRFSHNIRLDEQRLVTGFDHPPLTKSHSRSANDQSKASPQI